MPMPSTSDTDTTLTETALAFYLVLAIYLALRESWGWSAAILSLCFVTRHEAIIFLPIWVVYAWSHGVRLSRLWPMFWAPIFLNIATYFAHLNVPIFRLLAPKPNTQYGHGGWFGFFGRSLIAWGIGVVGGGPGSMMAVAGLLPLGLGIINGCIFAPLLNVPFRGADLPR